MNENVIVLLGCMFVSAGAVAGAEDDPLLFMFMIDKLEYRAGEGKNPVVWDVDAWLGKDLNKAWFRTEGEYRDGQTEAAYGEALYSRAIAPFWNIQTGWRRDFRPEPNRDWYAIGVRGLAPYHFDVRATLYAGATERRQGSWTSSMNGSSPSA